MQKKRKTAVFAKISNFRASQGGIELCGREYMIFLGVWKCVWVITTMVRAVVKCVEAKSARTTGLLDFRRLPT